MGFITGPTSIADGMGIRLPAMDGSCEVAAVEGFLRWISLRRSRLPFRKFSLANSHRSGSTLRKPYVFSWRTKLLKFCEGEMRGAKQVRNCKLGQLISSTRPTLCLK